MTSNRIGVDVGGTKIHLLSLDADQHVLHDRRIDTPASYDAIVAAVAALVSEAGDGTVGIGAPGSTSPLTGLWRNSNIVACNGRPFHADLQAAIRRPIRSANDANCFALSEASHGAGRGHGTVAFFTIGTGLGGGLVIGGTLIRGAHDEAAEFGHTGLPWLKPEDLPPTPCFCGKSGCVEMYVSGTGLAKDYLKVTGTARTAPEIVAAARRGDTPALDALRRLQLRFARTCANIVNVVDPDIIVMGGGMAALPELVEELPPLIARYSFSGTAAPLVARATFADSGARGAALLWA
ncbi:MAG: ROK family protein [Gemmatimonadota bacterium]